MNFERDLFAYAAAFLFALPAFATESVKPPVTPPGAPASAGKAAAVGGVADIVEFAMPLVIEYGAQRRIDADIKRSLQAAEPKIRDALDKSGDKGVLVTARHERLASDGNGVRGATTRLAGEVAVGNTGSHPVLAKMKTASLTPTMSAASASTTRMAPGHVPDPTFNRMYWAERGPGGKIMYRPVNIENLRKVEIITLTDRHMKSAVERINSADQLTARVRVASQTLTEEKARLEASTLLKERDQAFKDADEVERWLAQEMRKAARANSDAAAAGTVSAVAGAGAAISGASAGGAASGVNSSSDPRASSESAKAASRNSILLDSSSVNVRAKEFLNRHQSAPGTQIKGPELPLH